MADRNLNSISTMWTVLRQAHEGPPDAVAAAQKLLIERYAPAARRYLAAALRDPHAADDLTQEFALALMNGRFHNASPHRGRFRNYVKTTLFHLVHAHRKKQGRAGIVGMESVPEPAENTSEDQEFDRRWRDQLLARAWDALADANPTFHAVLRYRAQNPSLSSGELADHLSRRLPKPMTADGVRQTLRRARDKFAAFLLAEVRDSLDDPDADIADELAELQLLEYCRPALESAQES